MIISNLEFIIFLLAIVGILRFIFSSKRKQDRLLIHRLYLIVSWLFLSWLLALVAVRLTDPNNLKLLYVWDALTNLGASFLPVFSVYIALTFVKGWEHLPRACYLLLIVPIITNIIVWTNPLHHLHYRVFSMLQSEIVFGPYVYVSGLYGYLLLMISTIIMINFAVKNRNRLYTMQVILLSLGNLIPLAVSAATTFSLLPLGVGATPIGFIFTIVLTGIAIYRLHLLDIKPIGIQQVLHWISDCYLILSDQAIVVDCNEPFLQVFGESYGISEGMSLHECLQEEDIQNKTPLYNLLISLESCRETGSNISYEQAVGMHKQEGFIKAYYIVDITALVVQDKLSGFVVIFKDITQVKRSMQQLQDSQRRMMEQERLAFLGQMAGGLAHNLKTPIMSISGCTSAIDNLVQECEASQNDPEVLPEDYREIYGEMHEWMKRIHEACSYMSEIISAIKGQAANVSTSDHMEFSLGELVRRSVLLVRHELLSSGCTLRVEDPFDREAFLQGDINNLIQVLNNLISNAVYAQKEKGGGEIVVGMEQEDKSLKIYVKDHGPGVDPRVKARLFREMITSKGTMGTGLGLYISDAVIKGKFGGYMWTADNPEGGATFGFSIPLEAVRFGPLKKKEVSSDEKE